MDNATDFYKLWHKDLLTDMKERRANAWNAFQTLENKNTNPSAQPLTNV